MTKLITAIPLNKERAWSSYDVIAKLIEASEFLLHKNNYDGHNHEEIQRAVEEAKKLLTQIKIQGEGK